MRGLLGVALQQPHGGAGVSERRPGAVHLRPRGGVQLRKHQLQPGGPAASSQETGQHRSLNDGHDPKDAHRYAQAMLKPFLMFLFESESL